MRAKEYIEDLAAHGRYHFTTEDALGAISGSDAAVRAQLRRLKNHGRIASPMRSFHVIVPPEYKHLGCLPAEHFVDQLMEALGEPYYVALLSAAERHGAAHQRPQSLQVMVRKNRPAIECHQVRIVFVARGDLERMPVMTVNTPRGFVRYSTPEVTALELVGYPNHGCRAPRAIATQMTSNCKLCGWSATTLSTNDTIDLPSYWAASLSGASSRTMA